MSVKTLVIAPPYPCFFIAGRRKIVAPINHDGGGLAATPDCITVPAMYLGEGVTTTRIGRSRDLGHVRAPDFEGTLDTPHRLLMISDSDDDLVDVPVDDVRTRIRIWLDRPIMATAVDIGWS